MLYTEQKGIGRKCWIIGNGHSLSVDDNNYVVEHDPFMSKFEPEISKEDAVYAFYFTFESSGLEESGKDIAEFVNNLLINRIFLVGHSKCGVCLANATRYCVGEVFLFTISTPFMGTVVADKEISERILKYRPLIKIYNMIFSDHQVDKDISPYSTFLQKVQTPRCKEHVNIVSYLRNIRDCRSVVDILLLFLNRYMKINGDGVVSFTSQLGNHRGREIYCSHARSLQVALKIIEVEYY